MSRDGLKIGCGPCIYFCILLLRCSVAGAAGIELSSGATEGVDELSTILYGLIQGVGDILLALGVWKFGIGMTSDDAREVSRGVSALVVGAILANIKTLMNGI